MAQANVAWARDYEDEEVPRTILLGGNTGSSTQLAAGLRQNGFRVTEAKSTAGFLRTFNILWANHCSSGPLELVILDLCQPEWAGMAMLEYVRRLDWALPVILIQPRENDWCHVEAQRVGVTAVFQSPYSVNELRTAVLKAIPIGLHANQ